MGVVFFETPSSQRLTSPDLNADQGAAGGWTPAGPVACSPGASGGHMWSVYVPGCWATPQ